MLPSERTMSVQPNPTKPDLDSTDELPVLDVVAYEAGLAETQRGLSRTDTWTVEALQDIDEIVDSVQIESSTASRSAVKQGDSSGVTVNVNRILKRISDLENDIVTAHEANAALQKRAEAMQAERDEHAARMQALAAENARISEHRALSEEMAQRLEQQLREQTQRAEAQIKQLHATHATERTRAEQERSEAERKLAQMAAEHERRVAHMSGERVSLQQEQRALQDQVRTLKETAEQQVQALASAAKALSHEQASSAQLARRLAVKLTDYDKLQSIVELRSRTIDELNDLRDDLSERLEEEVAARAALETRFSVAERGLDENHELLLERENALAAKDETIAKLTADIAELRNAVEVAERKAIANQDDLSAAGAARAEMERNREQLEAKLMEAQGTIATLINERDAAQAQIRTLNEARDTLLPAATKLAARTAELEKSTVELAKLREELVAVRADAETRARLLAERADELTAEKTRFEGYESEMEKLEDALRTRDELAENLRTQVQSALDNHAMLAGQLDKARARVKSLTQEIFRRDHQIVELQADLAVHTEALAAIRQDVNRIGDNVEAVASSNQVERVLEPFEHNGPLIVLTGKMLTIGRTNENDICLPSKLVSRNHARLLVGPNGVIVEDAGSTNGCYVNGEQVRHHLMRDGDMLELGDMRYRLRTRAVHDTAVHPNVVQLFDDPDDEFRNR